MRAVLSTFAAAAVLASAGTAAAQDASRYRLERTENGFVRMDTRTGQMSFCEERSGELACTPAQDDRAGNAAQLDELSGKIEALESRLAALEGNPAAAQLPTEEEFEQTISLMERFLRRFWGVAKDLERESEAGTKPAPDRT